jgi:predicted amidohydrolase YtcJ
MRRHCGDRQINSSGSDIVVVNGRIYTVDDTQPVVQAFAVKADRFVAVGSNDDIRNLATRNTTVIDAEGMTVTPGFIDAHSHPAYGGIYELVQVNCDLRSIPEIQAALRTRATQTPPGEWVLGFKYDDTKVREGRRITRKDLDEAVPDHPV